MKKLICLLIFVGAIAVGHTFAQNGTVRGNIAIKKMSGNNLGSFSCSNLTVTVASVNRKRPYSWIAADTAKGDIKNGQCRYSVSDVRLNSNFTVTVTAAFPKACDNKVFKPDSSFPMKTISRRPFEYNLAVYEIGCTLLK